MIRSRINFRHDERGAVAPLAAVMLAALVGLGGLAVDAGVWYVKRRSLQQAVDAAAMAAVSHTATASAVAGDLMGRNGYAASDLVSVETGYYCADASLAPAARFTTGACPTGEVAPTAPNAVRVTARTAAPLVLSAAIGASAPADGIRVQAVATRIDEAGLEIRSGLASADLPIANATLQSLLGGSGLNLTAAQYDGLLGANVDALALFDRLAANAGIASGTYGAVLDTPVRVTDLLQAAADVLTAQGALTDTTGAVAGLQALKAKVTGAPSINLGSLVDLGVWKNETVGASASPASLKAGLNAYQLAAFALQLAGQSHPATMPTLGISGLAGASIDAVAIEPPQSAYFAFGPEGVTVHTAQVRMKLTIDPLNASLVTLPLYVEVASGTATLAEMDCGADPAVDAWARVRAQSGVATAYIGTVPGAVMTNFSQPAPYASVSTVPIIDVTLLKVKAKAKTTAGSSTPTDLMFYAPPANGVVPGGGLTTTGYMARIGTSTGQAASPGKPAEVVSTGIVGGLTSGLVAGVTDIEACVIVCTGSLPLAGLDLLNNVLQPLLAGVDPLVDGLLQGLGVKLGRAEVAVTGARCGVPVIVS
jgi:uncharacterized membrane protein